MKFVVLLILIGFAGVIPTQQILAQNLGDGKDDTWLPGCHVGTGTECDYASLFHDAIAGPFAQSDSVAIATIVQKEAREENSITYSINVDFYLKNYQSFDLITATLNNATEPRTFPDVWYYNSPVFNEGDLVFVYLAKDDGQYELLPESFALDKQEVRGPPPTILLTKSPSESTFVQGEIITVSGEVRKTELVKAAKDDERLDVKVILHKPYDASSVIFSSLMDVDADGSYSYGLDTSNIPPGEYELVVNYGPSSTGDEITIEFNSQHWTPLKQFRFDIPLDEIKCKEGLVSIQKHDGSPACVKEETIPKLIERDWTRSTDDDVHRITDDKK